MHRGIVCSVVKPRQQSYRLSYLAPTAHDGVSPHEIALSYIRRGGGGGHTAHGPYFLQLCRSVRLCRAAAAVRLPSEPVRSTAARQEARRGLPPATAPPTVSDG